jgi:hypothetical protein
MTAQHITYTKIAIDPGFGGIKIAWFDDSGHLHTQVVPSVVGLGQVGDLSMLGLGRQRKTVKPFTIGFEPNGKATGRIYFLVGENVHRHGEPIEDLNYLRLSEGQVIRALLYAALGNAVNGHPIRASVMFGFPVEIMKDKPAAQAHLRNIRAWFPGLHCFSVDGRQVQVEIDQVKAIAQPVGAYFDWGLDNAGEWVREKDALKKPIGVCDVGFNTIDLFSVESGEIVDRFTDGDTLGMHRVARAIQRHVRDQHGVQWSLHQADALVRSHLDGHGALFYCADGEIDLSGVVKQALDQAATSINEFITARWGKSRQFYRIIITGGGAEALRTSLLRHHPAAYIPQDPVCANARGLLKWAQRAFKDAPAMPSA